MVSNPMILEQDKTAPEGGLPAEEVTGQVGTPGAGPYLTLHLTFRSESITAASFSTYGCPYCIACGNWISQWVVGRTAEQVSVITPDDLARVVGGIPLGKEHCAQLAVGALQDGVEQWRQRSQARAVSTMEASKTVAESTEAGENA